MKFARPRGMMHEVLEYGTKKWDDDQYGPRIKSASDDFSSAISGAVTARKRETYCLRCPVCGSAVKKRGQRFVCLSCSWRNGEVSKPWRVR